MIIYNTYYPVAYSTAIRQLDEYFQEVLNSPQQVYLWTLEHNSVFTVGAAGLEQYKNDVLDPQIELVSTKRGGRITYHGPGQRIIYITINLHCYGLNLSRYLHLLENTLLNTLQALGVPDLSTNSINRGIYYRDYYKVGFIGLCISKGIAYYGCAVNLEVDLTAYTKIISCGLETKPVSSLHELGYKIDTHSFDDCYLEHFLASIQQHS